MTQANSPSSSSSSDVFPFSSIVVTNPDQSAADAAQRLLDDTLAKQLAARYPKQTIRILSTYDPYGSRVGSGGGTLAAVEKLLSSSSSSSSLSPSSSSSEGETVLCLHAGGDSSRCPLSMILGKAWTSLPTSNPAHRNPTVWLIKQLLLLHRRVNFPSRGCLWVAATDTLLTFFDNDDDGTFQGTDEDRVNSNFTDDPWTVLGVAVPAPVTTAKNHGVYVMKESTLASSSEIVTVESPVDVWQKPTIEKLISTSNGASFDMPSHPSRGYEKHAWIDTGIVIFFPKAFETLLQLSKGILSRCTWSGLENAYQEEVSKALCITQEQFAKKHALKIDLYTDIMHNLSWAGKEPKKDDDAMGTDAATLNSALQQALSKLKLKTLLVANGMFLHLGTTRELLDFITHGSIGTTKCMDGKNIGRPTTAVAKALRLEKRNYSHGSISSTNSTSNVNESSQNVINYSIFPESLSEPKSFVGSSTYIEYCDFQCYGSVTIGNDCILSGWREISERSDATAKMKSLTIPDSLSVQMLSLKTPSKFVYLVLGTDDGIKKPIHDSTLYGVNFLEILMKTELSMEDIFSSGDITKGTDCLWTAKIHPVVSSSDSDLPSFESLFGWINLLRSASYQGIVQNDPSFQSWLSSKRVSLKDLHGLADAGMEWVYRNMLEQLSLQLRMGKTIAKTTILLRQRCHDQSCDDLMWLTEIANRDVAIRHLMGFVSAINQSAVSELKLGNDDISGRYLMLASTAIAEFAERLEMDIELNHEVLDKCNVLVQKLKHSSTYFTAAKRRVEIVEQVLLLASTCVGDVKEPSISTLSIILEKLALCLVECTISDGFRQVLDPASDGSNLKIYFERTESPVFDKWVVSTAPVRVDLAGGWSDTPPICYENGGSVTGMALLVDDNFPLLSRCRIVQGGTGISIRSEIRNGSDHSLSLCQEVRIDDSISLDDFRTPTSECALSKACLVCLGMATEEQLQCSTDLQKLLNAFCGTTDNVGMEIVTTSLIGMGSGMGTSSILAACVLSSISKCVGIGDLKHELIIHAVLMVEQLLSSGGGWQDQAHGISPGMKTVRSQPPKIPLTIQSEPLDLSTTQIDAFEERLVFVFTGKTRLAKNILQQVLRRWSKRTDEIVKTVHGLVDASENLRKAALNGDWDAVAECMDKSFHLKCVMAGESSGALPRTVNLFVEELKSRDLIKGAMLCGAGGGGFLLMIATEGTNRRTIEDVFKTEILCLETEFTDFTFHGCSIATQGLATEVLVDDDEVSLQSHSLSWHRMR